MALVSASSMSEKAATGPSSISASLAHCLSWAEGVMCSDGEAPCLTGRAAPGDAGSAAGASNDAAVGRETVLSFSVAPATLVISEPLRDDELRVLARSSLGVFSSASLQCSQRGLAAGLQIHMTNK